MNREFRYLLITICLSVVVMRVGNSELEPRADAKTDTDQPKYALLVGVTKYKSESVNPIDGCENNVPLLANTLIDSYGFKKDNVVTLINEGAGKEAILRGFRSHLIENARQAKQQGREAVVLYYFCGHGSQYPDQDKDENDGLDETFVAWDSRTGSTPDILDDEIDDLKAEIRSYTSNTTLILESCHSGTGSRGDDGDNQFISEEADPDKRTFPPYERKFPATRGEDEFTYTEIAASASTNTAKSESREFCKCDKPLSLMTKALVEGLNRANYGTTYRGLMREVSYAVAERSRQEPQVEGNRDTLLFRGTAKRTKPYIEIEALLPNDQILIRAGRIHGLKEGSQIAIYAAASVTDSGDNDWLTNGSVVQVRDFQSVVQLPTAKENSKPANVVISSHVVLTSPVFGGGPVLVTFETGAGTSRSRAEAELLSQVQKQLTREKLTESGLIEVVQPQSVTPTLLKGARGILRLKKGKFSAAFPSRIKDLARLPRPTACSVQNGLFVPEKIPEIKDDTEVYYLDDGNPGGTPLFGRVFLLGASGAMDIASTIRNYAFRTNLESLNNNASTLPASISLTVNTMSSVQTIEECDKGKIVIKPKPGQKLSFQAAKDGRIPLGSIFSFTAKNISGELKKKKDPDGAGEPIYVTAIFLRNDGNIDVVYSGIGSRDSLADGSSISFGVYIASKPKGAEHLIVIVSKSYVDFSFYGSSDTSRHPTSILEQILRQSGTKTRELVLIPDEPNSWGVLRIDLDYVN